MIPAITEPGKERENLSALARSCAGVGSAIPTVLTMIVVPAISGAALAADKLKITDYRIGFKWWALLVAVVFVISEAICVANVKEKGDTVVESHGIGEMFHSLVTNDQALAVVITIVLVNSALYITSNLLIYFFTYDIGSESGYALFSAFGGGAQILAMMLFPLFRKKMSKRKLFVHSVVYEIVGYVMLLACSLAGVTRMTVGGVPCWYILFIPGLLVFAGSGLLNVLITVCLADSIDYGECHMLHADICSKACIGSCSVLCRTCDQMGRTYPAGRWNIGSHRAEHRNSHGTFHDDDSRSDSPSHHRTCILHQEIQADRGEDAGDHDET